MVNYPIVITWLLILTIILSIKYQKIFRIRKVPRLTENNNESKRIKEEIDFMEQEHKKKKADEISQVEKDDLEKLRKELWVLKIARKKIFWNLMVLPIR